MVKVKNFEVILPGIFSILMLFFLAIAISDEVETAKKLTEFENKNKFIELENNKQEKDLKFYNTTQFKEIYAKENLGLIKNGEKVIVIKEKINNLKEEEGLKSFKIKDQWKKYFNLS